MQILGGFYVLTGILVGVIGTIGGIQGRPLLGLPAGYWIGAGLATVAFGTILLTLNSLSETSRRILTVLLSTPDTKPTQCPKCGAFLTGEQRFGKCYWCSATLPSARAMTAPFPPAPQEDAP